MWRGFRHSFVNYKKGCTRLAVASDKVYQLLAHGRWFSPGTPASSTTKTGCHDIAEILLKVAINTKNPIHLTMIYILYINIWDGFLPGKPYFLCYLIYKDLRCLIQINFKSFLAHLTQRVMWAIPITWRPSSSYVVNFSKIFSSESTRPMETKLGLNHH
jgi:hypothetical protein